MRVRALLALLAICAMIIAGCGELGDTKKRDQAKTKELSVTRFAARPVPADALLTVVLRVNEAERARSMSVVSRLAGWPLFESQIPSRERALFLFTQAVNHRSVDEYEKVFADEMKWLGDEIGYSHLAGRDGSVAWAEISRSSTGKNHARRFVEAFNHISQKQRESTRLIADLRVDDGFILIGSARSLKATATGLRRAARSDWQALGAAQSRKSSVALISGQRATGVVGIDNHGLWAEVSEVKPVLCRSQKVIDAGEDPLKSLKKLPVGTTLGRAGYGQYTQHLYSEVEALRVLIKDTTDLIGAEDYAIIGKAVNAVSERIVDPLLKLLKITRSRSLIGLGFVGSKNPEVLASLDGGSSGALASDNDFTLTIDKLKISEFERVDTAWWIDPVRILRELSSERYAGRQATILTGVLNGMHGVILARTQEDLERPGACRVRLVGRASIRE